jgi:hypothetical protein
MATIASTGIQLVATITMMKMVCIAGIIRTLMILIMQIIKDMITMAHPTIHITIMITMTHIMTTVDTTLINPINTATWNTMA